MEIGRHSCDLGEMYWHQPVESYRALAVVGAVPLQPMIQAWVEAQTGSLAAPNAEVEVVVVPVADDSTPPIRRDLLAEIVGWSYSDL